MLESYRYDLYGTPSYFNSTSQPLNSSTYGIVDLYAGERWIPELRLYDLRNRFMSPDLGRFLQPDPIGFKGDASNLYRYCGNDPVDRSDPTGLYSVDPRYSSLTSMGGGDWVKGSDGLTASDWNHGMGSNRPQAGMDGGGGNVERGGGGGAPNEGAAARSSGSGGGVAPPPPGLVRSMYAAHLKNVEAAKDPQNWDTFPGTTKVRKNEFATAIYQTRNGLQMSEPHKGYWQNGPKSEVPGGPGRVAGVHVHVTGNGRYLIWDRDQAIRNHYISGVGHISAPRRLDIFVPSGSSGAYFHTDDGEHVHPGH